MSSHGRYGGALTKPSPVMPTSKENYDCNASHVNLKFAT
jgi:hypothetical protein